MVTVVELKKKCKELKLKGYSKMNKKDLEQLIKEKQQKKEEPKRSIPQKAPQGKVIPKVKKKLAVPRKKKVVIPEQQKLFGLAWDRYRWIDKTFKCHDGFTCIKLYDDVHLFRGNKIKTNLQNKETYFAPWHGTTINYLPKKGTGYLEIYKLKNKNLNLFDLSDLENVNRLLRESFHNKEEYTMMKNITIGKVGLAHLETSPHPHLSTFYKFFSQLQTDTQPYQFKTLLRTSIIKEDFKFGQWLCKHNFDGYAARDMFSAQDYPIKKFPAFPAEIMLCTPKNDVQLVKRIDTIKYKTKTAMQQSIGREYLNPML